MRLFILLLLFMSCSRYESHQEDLTITKSINLTELHISNITDQTFDLTLGYQNTMDRDYTAKLYYCNLTDSPDCNPKNGTVVELTDYQSYFQSNVKVSSPNDPTDTLSILVELLDSNLPISTKKVTVTLKEKPESIISVVDNGDDGESAEDDTGALFPDGDNSDDKIFVGRWDDGNKKLWGYFRFKLDKDIPKGATITNAVLSVVGVGTYQWDTSNFYLTIVANDSSNIAQNTEYNDTPGELNGNLATNTEIRWPLSGGLIWNDGTNVSPNINSIIQELVDKNDGLSKDSYIQLWIVSPNFGISAQVLVADFGHANFNTNLTIQWNY